jgi:hypothetical protein
MQHVHPGAESDECSPYAPLKFLLSNIEKSACDIDPPLPTVTMYIPRYGKYVIATLILE